MPRPGAYRIEATDLELTLTLQPIPKLWPHEHVDEPHVDALERDIREAQLLRNPIITARDSNVVLDGMHRLQSLRRLGSANAPVCQVPYHNPAVSVGSWSRRYGPTATAVISTIVERLEDRGVTVSSRNGTPSADQLALITDEETYTIAPPSAGFASFIEPIQLIVETFQTHGHGPTLHPASDGSVSPDGGVVVRPPPPSKDAVIRAATEGPLLPPNTSRHVIPSRPIGLDVPLSLLDRPLDAGRRSLDEHVRTREVDKRQPDATRSTPRYTEELLVFRCRE